METMPQLCHGSISISMMRAKVISLVVDAVDVVDQGNCCSGYRVANGDRREKMMVSLDWRAGAVSAMLDDVRKVQVASDKGCRQIR